MDTVPCCLQYQHLVALLVPSPGLIIGDDDPMTRDVDGVGINLD
jgi:hypothetical protein